jgi:ParB family chromosome partitioning protein
MNSNNIRDINIAKLHPHPQNPRQDPGDLSELADSIRENGIMQNLTVVKAGNYEEGNPQFTVLIGHRRLAAAKLAEIEIIPCAVVTLDEREQMSVMLTENMQRTDLTIAEQAHGIQLMLDLGDTVADVAKRTGFSEATIRRRARLAALDAEKLQASIKRGATLFDYEKIQAFDDPDIQGRLLDVVGTQDFEWTL